MKLLAPLSAALLCIGLAACGGPGDADDGRVQVVASFYPAAFVAERVGGEAVDVTTLTAPGAEAHALELTARQVVSVQEADVVVFLSGFQAAVDHAVAESPREADTTADLAAGVTLLASGHDHDEDHDEEHGDDHDHGDHDHGDHDRGDHDPHVWLDPANLAIAAETVRDALVRADPDRAATYQAGAEDLIAELTDLSEQFTSGLASCERRDFVTSHAAFSYLAHAFDLHQIAISGVDPHAEPSTAALAQITDLVTREGITTVFTEPLSSPALAETVARETGATTAVLDPIEGLSDETADEDYLSLMRQNLAALQQANGCA